MGAAHRETASKAPRRADECADGGAVRDDVGQRVDCRKAHVVRKVFAQQSDAFAERHCRDRRATSTSNSKYASNDPAFIRAKRAKYDAIQQFYARANALKKLGHAVDKIEVSVLGDDAFSAYPRKYRTDFLRDVFWAANTLNDDIQIFHEKRKRRSIGEEIRIHETSSVAQRCRIVGLTLETRPEMISDFAAVRRLREFGATRLQIGVEHTDAAVLSKSKKKHSKADAIRCVRLLKNSGFKVDLSLTPNLATSDAAKDKAMFDAILNDDQLQCDEWKVSPPSDGENSAYPLTVLMEVVIGFMDRVKPWMRINRIFRSMLRH